MMKATNDNEPLTFTQLGLAAALVVNRIRNAQTLLELVKRNEQEQEKTQRNTERSADDDKRTEEEREYIEARLRELRSWERKISGKKD